MIFYYHDSKNQDQAHMKNLASTSLLLLSIVATATEAASLLKFVTPENKRSSPAPEDDDKENHQSKQTFFSPVSDFMYKMTHHNKDFSDSFKSPIELPKPVSFDFLGFKFNDYCDRFKSLDFLLNLNTTLSIEEIGHFIFCPNVLEYIVSADKDDFIEKYKSFKSKYELITVLMLRKATLEGIYSTKNRIETFEHCMKSIRTNLKNPNWPSGESFSAESVKNNFVEFVKHDQYCKSTFGDKLESYADGLKHLIEENEIKSPKDLHQALEGNLKISERLISSANKEQVNKENLAADKIGDLLNHIENDDYSHKNKFIFPMAMKRSEEMINKTDTLATVADDIKAAASGALKKVADFFKH